MNHWLRNLWLALTMLGALAFTTRAEASHFRYGSISWTVPDPVGAPRTVRFTVTAGWRATLTDSTSLDFGDGTTNPATQGTVSGMGTDAAGNAYVIYQYTVTHTYAAAGTYVAEFNGCCRIAGLQNGAGASYRVETTVSLLPGNTSGPVTASPAIIQMQVGNVRTYTFPESDPDFDPVTCRFATASESGLPAGQTVPSIPGTGAVPTLSSGPLGCTVTWDVTGAVAGQQYVLHLVLESTHGGGTSTTAVDLLVEMVTPPPPTCSGSGSFVANVGTAFSTSVTGTYNVASATVSTIGSPAGSTLTPGGSHASPFTNTFAWTPGTSDAGTTRIVLVNYTTSQNLTGTCALTIQVPQCPNYGAACSVGVGACRRTGSNTCASANVTVCSATAGSPSAEVCDNIDNDCDGTTDNGNPGGNVACSTGLPGVCAAGTTQCTAGALRCNGTVAPGSRTETCNGSDDNCDGATDEGFNLGMACTVGVGACSRSGALVCNGSGTSSCSATAGSPSAERCDNVDNNCDGATDEGFNLGMACTVGVGACSRSGALVCNGSGTSSCSATAGSPSAESCDNVDNDCDGTTDNGNGGCSGTTPICVSSLSRCVSCTSSPQCPGTAPVCDSTTLACRGCNTDTECVGRAGGACASTGSLAGTCVECSASNRSACSGATPACDVFAGACIAAPTVQITTPADGSTVTTAQPSITGTATPGTTVTLVLDGASPVSIPVDASGNWSFVPVTGLGDGTHQAQATDTDRSGNQAVNASSFRIDTTPPAVLIASPASGTVTNDARPAVIGTSDPSTRITVVIDSGATVMVTSDASGNWSIVPSIALGEGAHTVRATATDSAGLSASTSNAFTVDTIAPVVTITTPANGALTNDTRTGITGTTEPFATVMFSLDGSTPIALHADAVGNWSYAPVDPLGEGPHDVRASVTDAAGNRGATAAAFTVDTIAPALRIDAPSNGGTVTTNRPIITGTTDPFARVTVVLDGSSPVEVTADANGTWLFPLTAPLDPGAHAVTARTMDAAGNVATDASDFTVDPAAPPLSIDDPEDGERNSDALPTIMGRTEPFATVEISIDGGEPVTVIADAAGQYTLVPPAPFADGEHQITAAATGSMGGTAHASTTFTVDTVAPAVSITAPEQGSLVNTSHPTLRGTAEPGALVVVTLNNGAPLQVYADTDGTWSITPGFALADGPAHADVVAMDEAGNMSRTSDDFVVDTTAPALDLTAPGDGSSTANLHPVIEGSADPGATVTLVVDGAAPITLTADDAGHWSYVPVAPLGAGPHTATATTQDAAGNSSSDGTTFSVNPAAPFITLDTPARNDVSNHAQPAITGTAQPLATVMLSIDGSEPIAVTADATGHWSYTPANPLADGTHTITATTADELGNTASASTMFVVDTQAPGVTIATPADSASTNEARPAITGSTEPGSVVTLQIDGGETVTVSVDATGHWSYTPDTALADGAHGVIVTATDAAGNASSNASSFTVDTMAPAIRIDSPAAGSTTANNLVTIEGTTEPFATVTLAIDGGESVILVADASGHWSYTPSMPLSNGGHTATATSRDAAGNSASATSGFTVHPPGACATSTECAGSMPVCDPASSMCRGCRVDSECTADAPVCSPSGACVACSSTERGVCNGATPVCGPNDQCVQCTTDSSAACDAMTTGSTCLPGNVCGCASDRDCAADLRCDLTMHRCTPREIADAGNDAATDSGRDAATDSGRDAATDSGRDAATDSGHDAGAPDDASADAAPPTYGALTGSGACACRAAGVPSGDSHGALALASLALGVTLVSRRRARRDRTLHAD